jgi:hypothetical protein
MDAISSKGSLAIIVSRTRIKSTISRQGTHPLTLWNGVAQVLILQLVPLALLVLARARLL